jgi:glucosamine-6-phosphate deaminase
LVTLTAETREANSRFFENDVTKTPQYAITMGIGTILRARRVLLIATGSGKQEIVHKTLLSKPDPQIPASALHLHADVEFVVGRS